MRGILLILVVLLVYNFVGIIAESGVLNAVRKIVASSRGRIPQVEMPTHQTQDRVRFGLQIPSDYNNLRVPEGRPKIDEASHSCTGWICLNRTKESNWSTTAPDIENTKNMPARAFDDDIASESGTTILPTIKNSSNLSTENLGNTNESTAMSPKEATINSKELPTTMEWAKLFPRWGGSGGKTESTLPTALPIFPEDGGDDKFEFYKQFFENFGESKKANTTSSKALPLVPANGGDDKFEFYKQFFENFVESKKAEATSSSTLPKWQYDEVQPRAEESDELGIYEVLRNYEVLPNYPSIIDVALQIQSIREVEETEQKIILDVDLMVHWHDYRLFNKTPPIKVENLSNLLSKYEKTPMNETLYKAIWKPDIFIERVVKVTKPDLMSSSHSVRYISETSSIVYTSRASVKVDCNMNFEYYPADTQNCFLDIRSYQRDERKLELRWNPGAYLVDPDTDDNFDMKLAYVARWKKRMRGINLEEVIHDVLQIKLSMRRRMTYHLLQTFIPSAFLVIITWLSFLIPEELIEGRIGISMTTLLTLTAMFSSVRENTPVVSYVRAIDIWMAYCIFTVFSTLLEFTFFVWLRNYKIGKRKKKLVSMMSVIDKGGKKTNRMRNINFDLEEGGDANGVMRQTSITEITSKAAQAFEKTALIFNQFAFGFFVFSFVIFNVSYWTWLILSSEHYGWEVDDRLNGGVNGRFGFIGTPEFFTNQAEPSTTSNPQVRWG